jgi:hypothetical protein
MIGPQASFHVFLNHRLMYDHSRVFEVPDKSFMSFAQVCRRWRHVALAARSLWVMPLFQWPTLAIEMISRAGDTPLNILWPDLRVESSPRLDYSPGRLALDYAMTPNGLRNIRTLSLYDSPQAIIDVMAGRTWLAPNLDCLCLVGVNCGRLPRTDVWSCSLDVRRLTHLEIVDCVVDLSLSDTSTLTHALFDFREEPRKEPAVEASIVAICTRAPMLRRLVLRNAIGLAFRAANMAHMVHLEDLEICDTFFSILALLDCMKTGSKTKLTLVGFRQGDEDITGFIGPLMKHPDFRLPGRLPCRRLSLTDYCHPNFDRWGGRLEAYSILDDEAAWLTVEIEELFDDADFASFFITVAHGFPLQDLVELRIELEAEWYTQYVFDEETLPPTGICAHAFGCMPKLQTLQLVHEGTIALFSAALSHRVEPLPCPLLHTLHLRAMHPMDEQTHFEQLLSLVELAVQHRHSVQLPLSTLILEDMKLGEERTAEWEAHLWP